MRIRGPVGTLVAVLALGAVLVVVNVAGVPDAQPVAAVPAAPPSPSPSTPAPTPSTPSPAPAPALPAEAVYTGRTSGNEVAVAIAVRDGLAAGYLCDGTAIEAWLEGTAGGDGVILEGRDGARVTATVDGAALFGTVWAPGGGSRPFSAAIAPPPAGLYQGAGTVDGAPTRIGWIVLPDGTQVGILRSGETARPAPALDPARGGVVLDGSFIAAEAVTGDADVWGGPR